jgi:hypothetical protein
VNRFRPLTVPELREELVKRELDKNGKKAQLLMRLAVWTRDEISKTCKEEMDSKNADEGVNKDTEKSEDDVELAKSDVAKAVAADFLFLESDEEEEEEDDDDGCGSDVSDDKDSVVSEELDIAPASQDGKDKVREQEDYMESIDENEDIIDEPSIEALNTPVSVLRSIFGHTKFREGQEWAISRCMAKQKSVLIAPTGFGKSLCYALPAAMMDGVCVVVSPLISLIEVRNLLAR